MRLIENERRTKSGGRCFIEQMKTVIGDCVRITFRRSLRTDAKYLHLTLTRNEIIELAQRAGLEVKIREDAYTD